MHEIVSYKERYVESLDFSNTIILMTIKFKLQAIKLMYEFKGKEQQ